MAILVSNQWTVKFIAHLRNTILRKESHTFVNFKLNGKICGKVNSKTAETILTKDFSDIFKKVNSQNESYLTLHEKFDLDFKARSKILNEVGLKISNIYPDIFPTFRNEQYAIFALNEYFALNNLPLASIERVTVKLFGFTSIGCHLTIFRRKKVEPNVSKYEIDSEIDSELKKLEILVPIRANTKKWPNFYDNSVAGGLDLNETPRSCIQRESAEEVGIYHPDILKEIKSIGTTSYTTISKSYSQRIQYNYKLDVSKFPNWIPKAVDGEVESFIWCSIKETLDLMISGKFKPNSALVLLHFFITSGIINFENTEDYSKLCMILNSN